MCVVLTTILDFSEIELLEKLHQMFEINRKYVFIGTSQYLSPGVGQKNL